MVHDGKPTPAPLSPYNSALFWLVVKVSRAIWLFWIM